MNDKRCYSSVTVAPQSTSSSELSSHMSTGTSASIHSPVFSNGDGGNVYIDSDVEDFAAAALPGGVGNCSDQRSLASAASYSSLSPGSSDYSDVHASASASTVRVGVVQQTRGSDVTNVNNNNRLIPLTLRYVDSSNESSDTLLATGSDYFTKSTGNDTADDADTVRFSSGNFNITSIDSSNSWRRTQQQQHQQQQQRHVRSPPPYRPRSATANQERCAGNIVRCDGQLRADYNNVVYTDSHTRQTSPVHSSSRCMSIASTSSAAPPGRTSTDYSSALNGRQPQSSLQALDEHSAVRRYDNTQTPSTHSYSSSLNNLHKQRLMTRSLSQQQHQPQSTRFGDTRCITNATTAQPERRRPQPRVAAVSTDPRLAGCKVDNMPTKRVARPAHWQSQADLRRMAMSSDDDDDVNDVTSAVRHQQPGATKSPLANQSNSNLSSAMRNLSLSQPDLHAARDARRGRSRKHAPRGSRVLMNTCLGGRRKRTSSLKALACCCFRLDMLNIIDIE